MRSFVKNGLLGILVAGLSLVIVSDVHAWPFRRRNRGNYGYSNGYNYGTNYGTNYGGTYGTYGAAGTMATAPSATVTAPGVGVAAGTTGYGPGAAVTAPGVGVNAGPAGAAVAAPGVGINAGRGAAGVGANVGVPGANVGAVSYTHLTLPTICSV